MVHNATLNMPISRLSSDTEKDFNNENKKSDFIKFEDESNGKNDDGCNDFDLGTARRERTERFVQQHRRTVTFSDMSDSSSPTPPPPPLALTSFQESSSSSSSSSSNQQYLQMRFKNMLLKKQMKLVKLVSLLLVSHVASLIPKNYFFFWYYFGSCIQSQSESIGLLEVSSLVLYQYTSPLSFIGTMLGPLAFLITHRYTWIHFRWLLRKTQRFATSKSSAPGAITSSTKESLVRQRREQKIQMMTVTNGILKETKL